MVSNFEALNADPMWDIIIRFIINLIVLIIVIRGIYYRYAKKKELAFSFFLMGIMIFLMCILLKNVEISLGIGFGLFALFSLLRFRTQNIPIKTMTYFFTIIGISAINSLANFHNTVTGPLLTNVVIVITVYLLEKFFPKIKSVKKPENEVTGDNG